MILKYKLEPSYETKREALRHFSLVYVTSIRKQHLGHMLTSSIVEAIFDMKVGLWLETEMCSG